MYCRALPLRLYSPLPRLAPYVQAYWTLESRGKATNEVRYLHPDGGSGFTLSYGDGVEIDGCLLPEGVTTRSRLLAPSVMRLGGSFRVVGVRFRPGGAYPFFGTPSLSDEPCAPAELRVLHARVGEAKGAEEWVAILERWLAGRHARARLSPITAAALREINGGAASLSVESLARRLDASDRHLERLFRQQVGYAPKQLARILRARRAKGVVADSPALPLCEIAYALGYADQAHFTREFKAVIGITPAALRAALRARAGASTQG